MCTSDWWWSNNKEGKKNQTYVTVSSGNWEVLAVLAAESQNM